MYLRMSTRRLIYRTGLLLAALVVLLPKLDLAAAPQLAAILQAVGAAEPDLPVT